MSKYNKVVGNFGEKLAEKYLIQNGLDVLDKNFLCKQGEIDIIAKEKDELVFVEVKTRTSFKYGKPAEAVNNTKKCHIYRAAKYYLYLYRLEDMNVRFDVIEIFLHDKKYYINHIKHII